MRKLILSVAVMAMILTLFLPATGLAGPRFQIGAVSFISAGHPDRQSIPTFRAGVSTQLADVGEKSALYGLAYGKYGKDGGAKVQGGDLELIFFPSKPTGAGSRLFLLFGSDFSQLNIDDNPVTYWQAASGLGLYHDFTDAIAGWLAGKMETSADLTTVHIGMGLSIAMF